MGRADSVIAPSASPDTVSPPQFRPQRLSVRPTPPSAPLSPQPPPCTDVGSVSAAAVTVAAAVGCVLAECGPSVGWAAFRAVSAERLKELRSLLGGCKDTWRAGDTQATPAPGTAGPSDASLAERLSVGAVPRCGCCQPSEVAALRSNMYDFREPPDDNLRMKLRLSSDSTPPRDMIDFARTLPRRWRHLVGPEGGFHDADISCAADDAHAPRGEGRRVCCVVFDMRAVLTRVDARVGAAVAAGRLHSASWQVLALGQAAEAAERRSREERRRSLRFGKRRRSSVSPTPRADVPADDDIRLGQILGLPPTRAAPASWQRALLMLPCSEAVEGILAVVLYTSELRCPHTGSARQRQIALTLAEAAGEYSEPRRRRELPSNLRRRFGAMLACMHPLSARLDAFIRQIRDRAPSPAMMYRAVPVRVSSRYRTGHVVPWAGFSSCSLLRQVADVEGEGTTFAVQGAAGAAVHFASSSDPSHLEALCGGLALMEVASKLSPVLVSRLDLGRDLVVLAEHLPDAAPADVVDRRLAATWESKPLFAGFQSGFIEPCVSVIAAPGRALEPAPPSPDSEEPSSPRSLSPGLFTAFREWLQGSGPLVLLTSPGSGRTTSSLALMAELLRSGSGLAPVFVPWTAAGGRALDTGGMEKALLEQLHVPAACAAELSGRPLVAFLDGLDECRVSPNGVAAARDRLRSDRAQLHRTSQQLLELQDRLHSLAADPVSITAHALRQYGEALRRRHGLSIVPAALAEAGDAAAGALAKARMETGRALLRCGRAVVVVAGCAAVRAATESALLRTLAGAAVRVADCERKARAADDDGDEAKRDGWRQHAASCRADVTQALTQFYERVSGQTGLEGFSLSPSEAVLQRIPGFLEMLWSGRCDPESITATIRRQVPVPIGVAVTASSQYGYYRRLQIPEEGTPDQLTAEAVRIFRRTWHGCALHACASDAFCRDGSAGTAAVHYRSLLPVRDELPGSRHPDQSAFWRKEEDVARGVAEMEAIAGQLRTAWLELTRCDVEEQLARRQLYRLERRGPVDDAVRVHANEAKLTFDAQEHIVAQLRSRMHSTAEPLRHKLQGVAAAAGSSAVVHGVFPFTLSQFHTWLKWHRDDFAAQERLFGIIARRHPLFLAQLQSCAAEDAEPFSEESALLMCDMAAYVATERRRLEGHIAKLEAERSRLLARPQTLLQLAGLQEKADQLPCWPQTRCVVTVHSDWLAARDLTACDVAGYETEVWRMEPFERSNVTKFVRATARSRADEGVFGCFSVQDAAREHEEALWDVVTPLRQAGVITDAFSLSLAVSAAPYMQEVCSELKLEGGPGLWELYEAGMRAHVQQRLQYVQGLPGYGVAEVLQHASTMAAAMLMRGRAELEVGELRGMDGMFAGAAAPLRAVWLLNSGLSDEEASARSEVLQSERRTRRQLTMRFEPVRRQVAVEPDTEAAADGQKRRRLPPRGLVGQLLNALLQVLPLRIENPADPSSRARFTHRSLMDFLAARALVTQRRDSVVLTQKRPCVLCSPSVLRFVADRVCRGQVRSIWDGLFRALIGSVVVPASTGNTAGVAASFVDMPTCLQRLADGAVGPVTRSAELVRSMTCESSAFDSVLLESKAPAASKRAPKKAAARDRRSPRGGDPRSPAAQGGYARAAVLGFIGTLFLQHRTGFDQTEGDVARRLRRFLHEEAGARPLHGCALTLGSALRLAVTLHSASPTAGLLPMHRASRDGHLATIRLLAAMGCDVNVQDATLLSNAPLHHVRNSAAADALLAAGADAGIRNAAGRSPLQCGVTCLRSRLSDQAAAVARLRTAVLRRDCAQAARELSSSALPPRAVPAELLNTAAELGCSDIVAVFLSHGVTVQRLPAHLANPCSADVADGLGGARMARHYEPLPHFKVHAGGIAAWANPLHRSAAAGHLACVKLLAAVAPGPAAVDSDGRTALHHCALRDRREAAAVLLSCCAPCDARDRRGATSLHLAAHAGHVGVASVLLNGGASVGLRWCVHQWTALHLAALGGHEELARLLLRHGAQPGVKDRDGGSPLDLAVQDGGVARVLQDRMGAARAVALLLSSVGDPTAKASAEAVEPQGARAARSARSRALWATALLAAPAEPNYYWQVMQRLRDKATVASQQERRAAGGWHTPAPPAAPPPKNRRKPPTTPRDE